MNIDKIKKEAKKYIDKNNVLPERIGINFDCNHSDITFIEKKVNK